MTRLNIGPAKRGVIPAKGAAEIAAKAKRLRVWIYATLTVFLFGGSLFIQLGIALEAGEAGAVLQGDGAISAMILYDDADVYEPLEVARQNEQDAENDASRGCVVILSDGNRASTGPQAEPAREKETAKDGNRYYILALNDLQQDKVYELCERYDVPPELVFGIISADALTSEGDGGRHAVMRINEANAEWCAEQLGVSDPMNSEQNIECGVYILQEYYHKYSDIARISMCYELGERQATELWAKGICETEYSRIVARETVTLTPRDRK